MRLNLIRLYCIFNRRREEPKNVYNPFTKARLAKEKIPSPESFRSYSVALDLVKGSEELFSASDYLVFVIGVGFLMQLLDVFVVVSASVGVCLRDENERDA